MVENFCGCCSLRTGTLVFGYILLVLSAFTLIQNFVAISNSNDGSQYGIIGTLINIVSVVLLIYGATKEKKIFVLIFLIWDAIGLVIVTILVIVLGIVAPIIFIALPFIAISVYLWYNVLCYFIYLREKEIHGDVEGRMSDQPPAYDHK